MSKVTKLLLFIIGIFLLVVSTAALLFWNNWRQDINPVVDTVTVSESNIKIGNSTKVITTIKTPWYRQLQEPISLKGSDDIQLTGNAIINPKSLDLKALFWELEVELIGFKQGTYQGLTLHAGISEDQTGKSSQITVELPDIKISSRKISKNDLITTHSTLSPDIFKIEKKPVNNSQNSIWLIVISLIIALILIWLFLRTKTPNAIKRIPAWEEAQLALNELKNDQTINDERFFVQLSDILRLYIEKRFRLHATEKTSEEFIREVRSHSSLSEEHKYSLESFMNTADMVKFAKMAADSKQRQECLSMAGSFVKETIPNINKEKSNV